MLKISAKTESGERGKDLRTGPRNGEKKAPTKEIRGGSWGVNFARGLLENSDIARPKKFLDILISLASQAAFVVLLILLPLCYTQALNVPEFERTMLIMPPPPPPPPPAAPVRVMVKPKASLFENGRLIAPRAVPKRVEIIKEAAQEPPGPPGIAGGVPGGVPGGTLGGVLGGIVGRGMVPLPPPSSPKSVPSNRLVRVGGRVQAPRLIQEVRPTYPALAKQTRTEGVVVLDCVIDQQGNVTQMKVASGHPLLVQAAIDAVRQWKYQPTLLNGEPVSVEMHVTVSFMMGS